MICQYLYKDFPKVALINVLNDNTFGDVTNGNIPIIAGTNSVSMSESDRGKYDNMNSGNGYIVDCYNIENDNWQANEG